MKVCVDYCYNVVIVVLMIFVYIPALVAQKSRCDFEIFVSCSHSFYLFNLSVTHDIIRGATNSLKFLVAFEIESGLVVQAVTTFYFSFCSVSL